MQYQATENGQVVQAAHSVVPLTAEFTADGKISGSSTENGCKLLGIWSQDPQYIVWFDLTLNSCRFPALDWRFTVTGTQTACLPTPPYFDGRSAIGAVFSVRSGTDS